MEEGNFGYFEIIHNNKLEENKIKQFFIERSFDIKEIKKLESKIENNSCIKIKFNYNQESLSTLELIKTQKLYDNLDFKITKIISSEEYIQVANKLINEEKDKKVITYPNKYEDNVRSCFMKSYAKEGLEFINQDLIQKQRGVIGHLIKKIGVNFFQGKSIMNISLPINIFDCRSMLEQFCYGYKHLSHFMDNKSPGNFEKLKLSFGFVVSTMHMSLGSGKPFNPILGETFQAKIGDAEVYMEQTSHHPPIFNYYVKHPEFISFGYNKMDAISHPNSLTFDHKGKYYIKFNDGTLHRFKIPRFNIQGLMIGKRYMNFEGSFVVEDMTNNMIAVANINEDNRGLLAKMFSSKKNFPDYFNGFIAMTNDVTFDTEKNIYRINSEKNIMSKIEGEWSRCVKFDGKDYWRQGENNSVDILKQDFILPSDSLYREDTILLKNGFDDLAQQAKTSLEEIQRNDRRLREYETKKNNKN